MAITVELFNFNGASPFVPRSFGVLVPFFLGGIYPLDANKSFEIPIPGGAAGGPVSLHAAFLLDSSTRNVLALSSTRAHWHENNSTQPFLIERIENQTRQRKA
jgi:hypothetical protein